METLQRLGDASLLEKALSLAEANIRDGAGGPFGAVVAREGRIIATGANQVIPSCDPSAHAEVVAIRRAAAALGRPHLEDCVLYASCEPCPMCLATAHWARLPKIVYALTREDAAAMGFDDAAFYEQMALPPERRHLQCVHAGLPRPTSLIEDWLRTREGRHY